VKCRISYNETIQHITYEHYKIKKVKTLQLVYSDEIDYQHKEEDREALKELYSARGKSDDIIIVKKGIVTDSYYCNLAFLRNKQWFTPANPLLHGTRRAQLLERKKIKTASIKATHIHKYEKVSLFNSMIPFGKVVVDISKSAVKK
jgi:4-amino-4-deoxychorismate lyase